MRIDEGPEGFAVEAASYRLTLPAGSAYARLADPDGRPWAELLLDASVHARTGLDETVARGEPVTRAGDGEWSMVVPLASSLWARKELSLEGDERSVRVRVAIEGRGHLAEVHLLGAWSSAMPRTGTGYHWSGAAFRSLFSPEPSDPARFARPASEPATLDVHGGGGPGRGHWFFTPPPFCFAVSRSAPGAGSAIPDGPWLGLGVAAAPGALTFGAVHFQPAERAFSIRLDYEGQTAVSGRFETPDLVLQPGQPDPYAAIASWAGDLRSRGLAPWRADPRAAPEWWRRPIFCGWGAQAALSRTRGGRPADHATQGAYDEFLLALDGHGVRPGTIVIDDRWQAEYGTGLPDPTRWPDLRGWIGQRHDAGQRVLLWWKAWDPEGVPPELCVRNATGMPVAVDPSNPAYQAFLVDAIGRLVDPDEIGVDGLKVDFTGLTPSGPGLRRTGPEWGVALLHRLVSIIHDAAHGARPDALVITHTPHPAFATVTDMLRLNDMLRLDEPDDASAVVEQMRHRARIVAAACPDVLIDTDDWAAPDLRTWRRYLALKPELGVPSLYYATSIDRTGEALEPTDYEAIRRTWAASRSLAGSRT